MPATHQRAILPPTAPFTVEAWGPGGNRVVVVRGPVKPAYLDDFPPVTEFSPFVVRLKEKICYLWGITNNELTGFCRSRDLVTARWAGMLIIQKHLAWSPPRIGRAFGNRDHTTVIHGIRQAKQLLEDARQPFSTLYAQLENSL